MFDGGFGVRFIFFVGGGGVGFNVLEQCCQVTIILQLCLSYKVPSKRTLRVALSLRLSLLCLLSNG